MFEKFLSGDSGDFRQRYEGTYGFFSDKSKGTRLLCYLERVDLDASPRQVIFRDHRDVDFSIRADIQDDIGFEFLPPKSSYYNTATDVFYVERIAARQFKRGICGHNTVIYRLNNLGYRPDRVNFDALSSIFEKQISFEEAAKLFSSGKRSAICLSSFLAINNDALYLNREPIGRVGDGKINLTESGTLFIAELQEALKNCGLTYAIISPEKD